MTDRLEISKRLAEWAELAGYTLTPGSRSGDGRAIFTAALGEIRLLIGLNQDRWIVITDSDRMGPEHFILAAPSMTVIERYLFGRFGLAIRNQRDLPRVQVPVSAEKISSQFRLESRPFEGAEHWTLIGPDQSTVAVGSTDRVTGTAELVKLSLFVTATIDEITSSAVDPGGKPLFQRR